MTPKQIAQVLRASKPNENYRDKNTEQENIYLNGLCKKWTELYEDFAYTLKINNSDFDKVTFMQLCGFTL